MNFKLTWEKGILFGVIGFALVTAVFVFYLFTTSATKKIVVVSPKGGELWEVTKENPITWRASGIKRVGIVIFKGSEPMWVARDVDAASGKYAWKANPGERYGSDYWVAIFEYPWKAGNAIGYSQNSFAIVYPNLENCNPLSISNEWPYVPSDMAGLRRTFITVDSYRGNMGGLEGADQICQREAQSKGFRGDWHAFLGGDGDEQIALQRLLKTPKGTEGVYVDAESALALESGITCHRLLGKNIDEFLNKFSDRLVINSEKVGNDFLSLMSNVWLGRINNTSRKNCSPITALAGSQYTPLAEQYTFTLTCQNWTQDQNVVNNYPPPAGQLRPLYPTCYTFEGRLTEALTLGALASGTTGGTNELNSVAINQVKACSSQQRLLCIED